VIPEGDLLGRARERDAFGAFAAEFDDVRDGEGNFRFLEAAGCAAFTLVVPCDRGEFAERRANAERTRVLVGTFGETDTFELEFEFGVWAQAGLEDIGVGGTDVPREGAEPGIFVKRFGDCLTQRKRVGVVGLFLCEGCCTNDSQDKRAEWSNHVYPRMHGCRMIARSMAIVNLAGRG